MSIPKCFLYKLKCPYNNQLCVSHIINNPNGDEIQGNFISFYTNEPFSKEKLKKQLEHYDLDGICLKKRPLGEGSLKKVFLVDKNGKEYAVSMEKIQIKDFETTVNDIYKEITTQQKVWSHYKDLTPKIHAANIFTHKKDTYIQLIMDNALNDKYNLIIDENLSSLNIIKTGLQITKDLPKDNNLSKTLKNVNIKLSRNNFYYITKYTNYSEEEINDIFKVFCNFDNVLEHWWTVNCTFLSSIFINLWKIHKLNILHQDLSDENMLCRTNDYDTYEIKFIDFGLSRSIDDWCSYYNEKYKKIKFTKLYKKIHNYFNNNPFEKQNLNNPSKKFLKYMMLAELSDFHNIIEGKVRRTYSFLVKSIFKDVRPIWLISDINKTYLETRVKLEPVEEVLNKFKLFVAKKYSEIVRSVFFEDN